MAVTSLLSICYEVAQPLERARDGKKKGDLGCPGGQIPAVRYYLAFWQVGRCLPIESFASDAGRVGPVLEKSDGWMKLVLLAVDAEAVLDT